jgi:molecular chaperone HscB
MNYFELYDLPLSLRPDPAAVKRKYYELSRRYHPDRFAQTGNAEQAEALKMASLNNAAWKTLSNPAATMAYVLQQLGLVEPEEKYTLPPAFLMEMMDLNEAVSDYEMDAGNEALRQVAAQALSEQLEAWEAATEPLVDRFETGGRDAALLAALKEQYMKQKYLLRIQDRMNTFASRQG